MQKVYIVFTWGDNDCDSCFEQDRTVEAVYFDEGLAKEHADALHGGVYDGYTVCADHPPYIKDRLGN